ncbi:MAG: ABC transporter ATP-binding protein [Myxococcales bacterium]|nr:MAG: ABC transporter ATP-binding protein [Myxococcales bacterium]
MSEEQNEHVLDVKNLYKTFHIGFFRKRVEAVRGMSFEVKQGEVLGLLGPNGAGKTTTIKSTLQLIAPSSGEIRLFGQDASNVALRKRIGYLPENPYVYQYLRPMEFLDLCGRLSGMSGKKRTQRAEELIEKVGLTHAMDRFIGKFSKGMLQRIGIAQALLHDPEFLILDEPMSGLDPIGRADVRGIIQEQHQAGKTILFTSHILSDVEALCERVVIMNQGKLAIEGKLKNLLDSEQRHSLEAIFVRETRKDDKIVVKNA